MVYNAHTNASCTYTVTYRVLCPWCFAPHAPLLVSALCKVSCSIISTRVSLSIICTRVSLSIIYTRTPGYTLCNVS